MLPSTFVSSLSYLHRLPIHPPPDAWESFTGYLTRLGAENGIPDAYGLFKTVGLSKELSHRPSECSPLSWGGLSSRVNCTEEQLLATTLYYIGEKFGRSSRVGSTSRFLSGVLSPYIRYCPLCLSQRSRYLLPWRFLTLEGCPIHTCMLLSECGHCGAKILPLMSRLRVRSCPTCRGDLSMCSSPPINNWQLHNAAQHMSELQFLLAAAPGHVEGSFSPVLLGEWLMHRRHDMGFLQGNMAELLDTRVAVIGAIERGDVQVGPSFDMYLGYCRQLGVTFQEAFMASVAPYVPLAKGIREPTLQVEESTVTPTTTVGQDLREEIVGRGAEELVLQRVLLAEKLLRRQCKPVTQAVLLEMAGLRRWNIERYPRVQAVLRALNEERQRLQAARFQEHEDALVSQVAAAIIELRAQNKLVSQTGVSRIVGVGLSRLNYYPKVRSVLRAASEGPGGVGPGRNGKHTGVPKGLSEAEMLIQVQSAIDSLRGRGKPATLREVTKWVNMPARKLREYPRVRALLDKVASERKTLRQKSVEAQKAVREAELLSRVLDAVESLQGDGIPVNQLTVSDKLRVSTPTLLYYPRVRAVVEEWEVARLALIESNRFGKEDLLLEKVKDAISEISESGRAVTQKAIEEWLGLSVTGLSKYPRVWSILQDLKAYMRRERAQKAAYQKRMLVSRTLRAVATLERRGEKVTYRAIEQLVGRTTSTLKRYPQIRAAVESSPNNPRNRKDRATDKRHAARRRAA